MRILFVTDLHGRTGHFETMVELARRIRPDVLILGGDALADGDIADPIGSQVRFLLHDVRALLASLKCDLPGTALAAILGNHDWLCTHEAMQHLENKSLIKFLEPNRPVYISSYALLGYFCAPPCPYPVKDFERLDYPGQSFGFDSALIWDPLGRRPIRVDPAERLAQMPSIQEELARTARPQTDNWIFVCHAPPFRTHLDVLTGHKHVGSQAVKDFILHHQPLLSLHGHIHESPRLSGRYWQRLGRTIAVNPGQRPDALAAVLIDLTEKRISLTPLGVESTRADSTVSLPRSPAGRSE